MLNHDADYFDQVVVISLPHRRDRLEAFYDQLPHDWPFRRPKVVVGIDGQLAPKPNWWNASDGAWGCYRSHLRAIEEALCEGHQSLLILEDDARCNKDFRRRTCDFLHHLPTSEGIVYLGGEHLRTRFGLPTRINEQCYRPFSVARTHAYGIRGLSLLRSVYEDLADLRRWNGSHHVDHHLRRRHEVPGWPVYCPAEWLVRQSAGSSNITNDYVQEMNFSGAAEVLASHVDRPAVAVLGTYRSGSSLVTGMLHHAGVNMGSTFTNRDVNNPQGYFEDIELAALCRRIFREPRLDRQLPSAVTTGLLRRWASDRCLSLPRETRQFGGSTLF